MFCIAFGREFILLATQKPAMATSRTADTLATFSEMVYMKEMAEMAKSLGMSQNKCVEWAAEKASARRAELVAREDALRREQLEREDRLRREELERQDRLQREQMEREERQAEREQQLELSRSGTSTPSSEFSGFHPESACPHAKICRGWGAAPGCLHPVIRGPR